MLRCRNCAVGDQFLELPNGGGVRKASFIQVHLVALFKNAHQFHAIERSKLQIGLKVHVFCIQLDGTACNSCDQPG